MAFGESDKFRERTVPPFARPNKADRPRNVQILDRHLLDRRNLEMAGNNGDADSGSDERERPLDVVGLRHDLYLNIPGSKCLHQIL
jgi:hypothetical protein